MNEKFLLRGEAAEYLTEKGLPTAKSTLQKLACIGGGPEYQRFGHRAVYRPSKLDAWAAQKLSAPMASASGMHAA